MDDVPQTNLVHLGLSYQDQLLGTIAWHYWLMRSLDYGGMHYEDEVTPDVFEPQFYI